MEMETWVIDMGYGRIRGEFPDTVADQFSDRLISHALHKLHNNSPLESTGHLPWLATGWMPVNGRAREMIPLSLHFVHSLASSDDERESEIDDGGIISQTLEKGYN